MAHQDWTPYGMADLATKDNAYLPAGQFETLELNDKGQVDRGGRNGRLVPERRRLVPLLLPGGMGCRPPGRRSAPTP